MKTEQSQYRRAAVSSCPEPLPGPLRPSTCSGRPERVEGRGTRPTSDGGFTLIEVLISTLVLTIGLVAIAALLAVTTQMQIGAREAARSSRLAQDKVDELMKLNFTTDAKVAVGGSLTADVADHSETLPSPLTGITLRWLVAAGPTDDTRVLTLRVVNERAQQYRQTDLATIIRRW